MDGKGTPDVPRIQGLGERDVQDGCQEKQDRQTDSRIKQAFFNPALCAEHVACAAKRSSKASTTLLQKDCRGQQDREQDLDEGKQDIPHNNDAAQRTVLPPSRQDIRRFLCYTEGMSGTLPWYRRPAWVIGISVLGIFLLGFGLFASQVWHYYSLMKSGVKAPLQEERLRASISKQFDISANTDVTRIMPRIPEPELGSSTAAVTIVEFLDYDCPFCRETESTVKEFLRRHGQEVRFMVREFPLEDLHPQALDAAAAARCVFLQEKPRMYWNYHDRLFGTQGVHDVDSLRIYAGQSGADMKKYDDCIQRRLPQAVIQGNLDDGVAAGVRGTPTFFFNGVRFQGSMTLDAMEAAFAEAKDRAKK